MIYVRLSVPVDRAAADAARRLREWVNTPGFADLCAGVKTLDVGTLERIHVAVAGLYFQTQEMTEIARGDRYPVDEGPPVEYVFGWVRDGGGEGGVSVRWRAGDPAGARARAALQLEASIHSDGTLTGARLSDHEPRTRSVL